MISFSDFSFTYRGQKNPTLKNLNFTINDGEKVLICGPSGSGKSTIGNVINGLIPNAFPGKIEGKAIVCDLDIASSDIHTISEHVGTVLQDTDGQFVGLSVGEDIAFALENICEEQDKMIKEVKDASSIVSMEDFLTHKPQELSGGQKQRVSLSGVLVENTDILLFDEPLANLDPATGEKTIELIDLIHKKTNKTIIIIEHRLEDVLKCKIDRVILVDKGTIKYNGKVNELLHSNLLLEEGIREPLYLSALKKANVDFAQSDVSSIDSFDAKRFAPQIKDWLKKAKRTEQSYGEELLRLDDVSFSYEGLTPVLKHVNFTLHKGEMVSLLGNNGAGKSTLASTIMGILTPDEGTVYLEGKDYNNKTIYEHSEYVGYVMQNPNHMISQVIVYDEVAFGLRKRGVSEEMVKTIVTEVLELCGLDKKATWPISALSYGQKKRVTIASILVMKPKLLILDEPTAGQDFYHYTKLMEFIKSLKAKLDLTIIFVTHDMHLALEYTPRSIVLSNGCVIADTKTSEVFSSPEILKSANLVQTSLYKLAKTCDIENIPAFIESFIVAEEEQKQEKSALLELEYKLKDNNVTKKEKKKKAVNLGERKLKFGLSYIPVQSPLHRLSGVTKFLFLFLWVFMCFTTFDIRILAPCAVLALVLLKVSNIPLKVFKPFFIAILIIVLNNAFFIFLFAPDQGTAYLHSRTVLVGQESAHYAITQETLWYLMVVCMKYLTIFPVALLFVSTTHPSEFASSLNKIKLPYKLCYSVALALRYLPDVINEYTHILHAQMCRGVDTSANAKIKERMKGIGSVLAPLIMSSLDKIDVITNALVLRGFGRMKKRTWYGEQKLKVGDFISISFVVLLFALSLYMRFGRGVMFYYPF